MASERVDADEVLPDPSPLLTALKHVIRSQSMNRRSEIPVEKVVQYGEISKTIDRLRDASTDVPQELRRLKLELGKEAEEYREANEKCAQALVVLRDIEAGLNVLLTETRAAISKLSVASPAKGKKKRYVKRTSPAMLARELRKAIRELGGAAKKADVLQVMRKNLDGRLKPQDWERDARGNLKWEKWTEAEKNKMVKAGTLRTGTEFGVWELRRR